MWDILDSFLKRTGIPFCYVDTWPDYCWDGEKINVIRVHEDHSEISNAIHEVGHWVVCPKSRINKPDFGLGGAIESLIQSTPLLKFWSANIEEMKASILGIMIEEELGFDYKKTIVVHEWTIEEYERRKETKEMQEFFGSGKELGWY